MSNQWHGFVGNLTRDPELKTIAGKNGDVNVANFAVAVNGRREEDTVFFECEVWGQGADVVSKWFKKGQPIVVADAEARMETWTDATTNTKRSRIKFRVNRFGFAPKNQNGNGTEPETTQPAPSPTTEPPKRTPPTRRRREAPPAEENEEEIPF